METNDNVYCTLLAARLLIDEEESWTKNNHAKDNEGHSVTPLDKSAICWCVVGAIKCFAPNATTENITVSKLFFITKQLGFFGVSNYNDNNSHKNVLAVLDEAIKNC
jgi:hypothetical protein